MIPSSLQQFIGHESTRLALKAISGSIEQTPHLMICGPPRIGKTTLVRCWLQDVIGMSIDHNPGVLFHDCRSSGLAGIALVRKNIKPYLMRHYKPSVDMISSSTPLLSFRWIIIDHAEKLTLDAQQALVRLAETYMTFVRFVFVIQEDGLGKLNDALKSRCSKLLMVNEPCTIEMATLVTQQYCKYIESIGWTEAQVLSLASNCGTMSDFFDQLESISSDSTTKVTSLSQQWLAGIQLIHQQEWNDDKDRALHYRQVVQHCNSVICLAMTSLVDEKLFKACECIALVEQTCLENIPVTLAMVQGASSVCSWLQASK